MAEERVQRRLAAILVADVVGYSRLMGLDEAGTLARVNSFLSDVIDPTIAKYRGRIVKTTGDGVLAEFASAVDAVEGAVEIQRNIADRNEEKPLDGRIEFRVGVNLGDIIVEGDDIFGEGVNVAARLEGLADPGDVFILGGVFEQVVSKIDIEFEDLGERDVKNIAKPVRVYKAGLAPAISVSHVTDLNAPVQGFGGRPAIAVLPFENMSGDPEQEYFADGIAEDIITRLASWRWVPVIARNSSFEPPQVCRRLQLLRGWSYDQENIGKIFT
jgi:adenylate cyclase